MDLINYFSEHHAQLLFLIAGISFIVELTVLGMSGPLLFIAIASAITGVLVQFNILSGWESELLSVGALTALIALLLWKPLKTFQNSSSGSDTSSDMIGKQVPSSAEITRVEGKIRFSGIDWSARLASDCSVETIQVDKPCIITGVDGNVMLVKPL